MANVQGQEPICFNLPSLQQAEEDAGDGREQQRCYGDRNKSPVDAARIPEQGQQGCRFNKYLRRPKRLPQRALDDDESAIATGLMLR